MNRGAMTSMTSPSRAPKIGQNETMETVDSLGAGPTESTGSVDRKAPARKPVNYTGFGASADFSAHVFKATVPAGRAGVVVLSEEYGYLAGEGVPERETRAEMERSKWTPLADIARKEFNPRLRARKVPPGSWKPGANLLDRMLGKELCVLMWASESAPAELIETICRKWAELRPEERWWLYAMTAAEAGRACDGDRGWRKALFHALSDAREHDADQARQFRIRERQSLSLF